MVVIAVGRKVDPIAAQMMAAHAGAAAVVVVVTAVGHRVVHNVVPVMEVSVGAIAVVVEIHQLPQDLHRRLAHPSMVHIA